MNKIKKFRAASQKSKLISLSVFIVLFGAIGVLTLLRSKAAPNLCSTANVVGQASYQVTVPESAQYRLWVRMQVPETTNTNNLNGVRVEFGGSSNQCFAVTTTAANAVNQWQWINSDATAASTPHITSLLSAGNYTAKILGLKAGVKVDKVLLLRQDNTCVPSNTVAAGVAPGDNCTTPLPTVNISASPTSVVSGSASTLTWSSTNATACTASGGWSGSRAISGSVSTGNLSANTTFTLACTGVGGTGNASTSVSVTSQPNLPNVNIVPGSLVTIPAAPKAGDEVKFQVTIKNDGAGATPNNVIHGVSFWVNNNNVAWSDDSTAALAPGATRVLTTNGGLDGNATWTAVQGSIPVTAKWDDVFRITESDTIKDTEERTITVTGSTIDTTPPTVTFTIPGVTLTPDQATVDIRDLRGVNWQPLSSDASGIKSLVLTVNGQAVTGTVIPIGVQANGDYEVRAVSTDNANNVTTKTLMIRVRHPDFSRDGVVGIQDLSALLNRWRTASTVYDINMNGTIDLPDLSYLLNRWGSTQ